MATPTNMDPFSMLSRMSAAFSILSSERKAAPCSTSFRYRYKWPIGEGLLQPSKVDVFIYNRLIGLLVQIAQPLTANTSHPLEAPFSFAVLNVASNTGRRRVRGGFRVGRGFRSASKLLTETGNFMEVATEHSKTRTNNLSPCTIHHT